MNTISKSKLKSNMLKIFRDIEKSGEELIVTDNNKPVLRIQPIRKTRSVEEIFGSLQGKVVYHEDINAPTSEEWPEI
ncbi:MAG: type II toxin-antitoxin system Phd/YefM family antitoxin [Desulfobacteraceae bacterium]|nr:MAG: type II toxin-antitoxin system Phd/YefM family antitoxin [Desulfobacteraceae bacterium]